MAGPRRPRLLQLPRGADQCRRLACVPASCHRPLAARPATSQPKGSDHVGTDDAAGGRLAPETAHPSPLAERALCRHTPEVGAVCEQAARTDLCGGRAMKRTSLPLRPRIGVGGALLGTLTMMAQAAEPPKILFLIIASGTSNSGTALSIDSFRTGLRDLGYVEGQTIVIAYGFADGDG